MKKSLIILVTALLFGSYNSYGQSFKAEFNAALKVKDMAKAEKILQDWDLADANDAELYVSYFNFFTLKSMEKDSTKFNKEDAQKALDFITEGIERFPSRFDMRLGKIYMQEKLKDYESFTAEIIRLIQYSKKIQNNWKGEEFRLLDRPDEMLEGAVQDFQEIIFSTEDTTLYANIVEISEEMLKYYPGHTQSLMNISTISIKRHDFDRSLDALLKADRTKADDSILKYNIAYVYQAKGDLENAKKYYQLTIDHAKEKEAKLKEAAQKQLNALK
jgi:tetratricopeptide (TPR) repeat protein